MFYVIQIKAISQRMPKPLFCKMSIKIALVPRGQWVIESNIIVKIWVHGKLTTLRKFITHDDVIKWKHFPRYWPFVREIHRSRWIPHIKASDAELWCFLYLCPNKRLSKQTWGWWFETLSWSLCSHCNANYMLCFISSAFHMETCIGTY